MHRPASSLWKALTIRQRYPCRLSLISNQDVSCWWEAVGRQLTFRGAARADCLSWLFWQIGSTPFLGGGFGHFYAYAPSKIEYAIDRYAMDVKRQLDLLD